MAAAKAEFPGANRSERRCLILVSRAAAIQEAAALAEVMLDGGDFEPVILCRPAALGRALPARLHSRLLHPAGTGGSAPSSMARQGAAARLKGGLLAMGPLCGLALARRIASGLATARATLARIAPAMLMVFDDRSVVPEMVWLRAAREVGIPSLAVPYASSSLESDAWTRRDRIGHNLGRGSLAWARRLFVRRYPDHGADTPYGRQMFYTLWDGLALAAFGLAGTRPWGLGAGEVDRVAVLDEPGRHEALAAGVPAARIVVTGQASLDRLRHLTRDRAALHADLTRRHGLDPARPLLVCAGPQWGEHGLIDWPRHIEETRGLYRALADSGAAVLISLHPKADAAFYHGLAGEYGLSLADEPLAEILPAAELFVASWSSTLRWAAMLGIASVNLDVAGQRYTMYDDLPALQTCDRIDGFAVLLRNLAADEPERRRLGAALQRQAAARSSLDGLACRRIIETATMLVDDSSKSREQTP